MSPQGTILLEDFGADVTQEDLNANIVNVSHVPFHVSFLIETLRADATLESLDVTNAVNSSHVSAHVA